MLVYDRRLLRQPRLYLAALLTLLLQAPTIIWNATENFASWDFILRGRHAGLTAEIDGIVPLVFGVLIFISPFPVLADLEICGPAPERRSGRGVCARHLRHLDPQHRRGVADHRDVVPLEPRGLCGNAAVPGAGDAAEMAARPAGHLWCDRGRAVFRHYTITPLSNVTAWKDGATAWSYGWAPTIEAIATARSDRQIGFIAASDYTTASLVGFMTHDKDVTSLFPGRDQFDYWFDPAAHAGQDALLFGDTWRPIGAIAAQFKTVTEIATLPVIEGGREIDIHHLYLATDFQPNG